MKTLKQLIEEKKCRKGPAVAVTKRGAFWLACEEIRIRSWGGDGVGNNPARRANFLQLRHYRDGQVRSVVEFSSWHQNSGNSSRFETIDVTPCSTVEEVIVKLKEGSNEYGSAYEDYYIRELTTALVALGMVEVAPSPDEEDGTARVGGTALCQ